MTKDIQQYQVLQWLLNHINPELFEMNEIVGRLQNNRIQDKPTFKRVEKAPTSLQEVLQLTVDIEIGLTQVEQFLSGSNILQNNIIPLYNNNETEDNTMNFAKILPQIDYRLNNIENLVFNINNEYTKAKLEAIPSFNQEQTPAQRQTRFVDKTKRICGNLSLVELLLNEDMPIDREAMRKYIPPSWSVSPKQKFYFEFHRGEKIEDRMLINHRGHIIIGRLTSSDITLLDATCSRQHCVIQFRTGNPDVFTGNTVDEAFIYDLGSTSGTALNGLILQPFVYYPIFSGDSLNFGEYAVTLILRDGTEKDLIPPSPREEPKIEIQEHDNSKDEEVNDEKNGKSLKRVTTIKMKKNLSIEKNYIGSQEDLKRLEDVSRTLNRNLRPNKIPIFVAGNDSDDDGEDNILSRKHSGTIFGRSAQIDIEDTSEITEVAPQKIFNEEDYKTKMVEEFEKQKDTEEKSQSRKSKSSKFGIGSKSPAKGQASPISKFKKRWWKK